MKPTMKIARSTLVALPFAILGGMATAGGLSEPIPTTTPAAPKIVPVAVPSSDWTGFYAGGQLGYGQVDSDDIDGDTDGAVYGAHAGYLYDLGSWVLGAEVDFDATSIENETDDVAEVDSVIRGKLRVGYDAGAWLPYATAGIAQASLSSGDDEFDDTGSFAGVGVEYRVSPNMRIGAEVLQHQFDDFDDTDTDFDATTAMARVSFQF